MHISNKHVYCCRGIDSYCIASINNLEVCAQIRKGLFGGSGMWSMPTGIHLNYTHIQAHTHTHTHTHTLYVHILYAHTHTYENMGSLIFLNKRGAGGTGLFWSSQAYYKQTWMRISEASWKHVLIVAWFCAHYVFIYYVFMSTLYPFPVSKDKCLCVHMTFLAVIMYVCEFSFKTCTYPKRPWILMPCACLLPSMLVNVSPKYGV